LNNFIYNLRNSYNIIKKMIRSIERFSRRLCLPKGYSFKLIDCIENSNKLLYDKFLRLKTEHNKKFPTIELYHVSRDTNGANSIWNNGFVYPFYCRGNKGVGNYLSNHSRYSWNWGGYRFPVLICHVVGNEEYVKRYKSEIMCPKWNASSLVSEFVVTNNDAIYPKYMLKYEVTRPKTETFDLDGTIGFVKHGNFECTVCDPKVIRCDCQQFPSILEDDIVD